MPIFWLAMTLRIIRLPFKELADIWNDCKQSSLQFPASSCSLYTHPITKRNYELAYIYIALIINYSVTYALDIGKLLANLGLAVVWSWFILNKEHSVERSDTIISFQVEEWLKLLIPLSWLELLEAEHDILLYQFLQRFSLAPRLI